MRSHILLLIFLVIGLWLLIAMARRGGADRERFPHDEISILHDGLTRSALVCCPSPQDQDQRLPLLLVFHGGGGNARGVARSSKMHILAREEGFILAYPNGTPRTPKGKKRTWNAGSNPPQGRAELDGVDDIGFIGKLLDELCQRYPVDTSRIYAAGMSKGGMFTYRLACEMSHRIAAIATVAATQTYADCRPAEPVSVLHIHGTNDQAVPFSGGRGIYTANGTSYPPVMNGLEKWARTNGCTLKESAPQRVAPDTTRHRFGTGPSGAEVVWCLVDNGGHAWPGAKITKRQRRASIYVSKDFSASREIWNFLERHSKPQLLEAAAK
jgi:polyhydroxybutyrate depolymerase